MPRKDDPKKTPYRVNAELDAKRVPEGWYLGFTCKTCKVQYAVFTDPSNGTATIPIYGDGEFFCDCPKCKAGHHYSAGELQAFKG